ncbi:MAG: hypothetical protein P4L40_08025, partial [Terracidiphilus sp.]|nr:hypothetical protein [Terracidiphilus sp.]
LGTRQRSKLQIVSQHDVDTAKAAYDRAVVAVTTAEAAVTQAEAKLKIDVANVNFAVIKSPVMALCSRGVSSPDRPSRHLFRSPLCSKSPRIFAR